ncbi:MAG: hypothetical protein M3O74_03070 [Pseudomonadota bacterium]|nr:hypothetical protein [Pseudomonadota bacterium]
MAYSRYHKNSDKKGYRMKLSWVFAVRSLALVPLLAAVSALSACSSAPPLFSSDGRPTSMINCPSNGGWSNCQENARAMCAGSYDVLDQSSENGQNGLLIACRAK